MMPIIGAQLSHVFQVIDAKIHPVDAGLKATDVAERVQLATQYTKVIMQIIVSLTVLIVASYLLLNDANEDTKKIASGLIGTVLGYWLR